MSRSGEHDAPSAPGAWLCWAVDFLLLSLGLFLLWLGPHRLGGDGQVRFDALRTLVREHRLDLSPYSLIAPLGAAGSFVGTNSDAEAKWRCERYNFALFVAGLGVLAWALRPAIESDALRRFSLLLVYGSMFSRHVQDFYGEVFSALMVGCGIAMAVTRNHSIGWLLAIVGTANAPASLPALGIVALAKLWNERRWRFLLIPIAAGAIILIENWLRRGSPFATGYANDHGFPTLLPFSGRPGFSYPLFFGLLSILLSFGKGLIFFAPGAFLPLANRSDLSPSLVEVRRVWLFFLAGLVIVYAQWWSWYGGWFWGPRFFLFASLPASLILALRLQNCRESSPLANVITLTALALSVWVGAAGAVFDQANIELFVAPRGGAFVPIEFLFWYVPETSVLWAPFVFPKNLNQREIATLAAFAAVFLRLALPLVAALYQPTVELAKGCFTTSEISRRWRW